MCADGCGNAHCDDEGSGEAGGGFQHLYSSADGIVGDVCEPAVVAAEKKISGKLPMELRPLASVQKNSQPPQARLLPPQNCCAGRRIRWDRDAKRQESEARYAARRNFHASWRIQTAVTGSARAINSTVSRWRKAWLETDFR